LKVVKIVTEILEMNIDEVFEGEEGVVSSEET